MPLTYYYSHTQLYIAEIELQTRDERHTAHMPTTVQNDVPMRETTVVNEPITSPIWPHPQKHLHHSYVTPTQIYARTVMWPLNFPGFKVPQRNVVYLLPSQVQWRRLRAPSTLFQCARWKKEYARASLSPRFNICSGGRTRLFCSNKY